MDEDQIALIVGIATVFGVFIALIQTIIARGQHKILEAENHGRQSAEWQALAGDWQICMLMALGPSRAKWYGVPESVANEYESVLSIHREIDSKWLIVSGVDSDGEFENVSGGMSWDALEREEIRVRELLKPYRDSCQRVLNHLAQVSSLVARGKLSTDSAYNAIGFDLLEIQSGIRALVSYKWGSDSSCPAPDNEERSYRNELDIDEISFRMGWGESLSRSRATAERILFLQSILIVHAYKSGDVDVVPEYHPESDRFNVVTDLAMPGKLGLVWRSARTRNLFRAIRFTHRVSRRSRKARRHYIETYDPAIWRWSGKLFARSSINEGQKVPTALRKILAFIIVRIMDLYRVNADILSAWIHSKKLSDVRVPDAPGDLARRFPRMTGHANQDSFWYTRNDQVRARLMEEDMANEGQATEE